MARKVNYLIGKAEQLTQLVPPPKMKFSQNELYSLEEIVERLQPQFAQVSEALNALPQEVCPRDYSVTRLTLHPSYIAKGNFPRGLLREMGVRSIGSKATEVLPDKWTRKGSPRRSPSTSLYVAGKRQQIAEFGLRLSQMTADSPGAGELARIWSIETVSSLSKIKGGESNPGGYYEVGLHLVDDGSVGFIKHSFIRYAESLGCEVEKDLTLEISNLWFVPVRVDGSVLGALANFSFVRVIRPMPLLRSFRPLMRVGSVSSDAYLPDVQPYASDVRVAILDGGLPDSNPLSPWVSNYVLSDPEAANLAGGTDHGLGVTSAFLFGPIDPGETVQRPFSYVDHYRVLDGEVDSEDPLELYRTLTHIEDVLMSRQYEFINISLGPNLPIDDDEVHPWTSLLDRYLSEGDTFLTIAAGNNGESDQEEGLCRIQVPSDSVNAIAVGASNSTTGNWSRAPYSAMGPGRAPGRVKPDLLAFGGHPREYFHVVGIGAGLAPTQGTSFASPYLLRKAVGVRAILGHSVTPLAIKALLVHGADPMHHDVGEVGWGKVPESINQLIESPDGVARILYQGELLPGKYLKVPLPLPKEGISGNVKIKATCCFSTSVDPQDSSMYTKAGVEITWRPKPGKTESFFKQKKVAAEAELRSDAGKWESVLHKEKNKRGSSMDSPEFEIHYMARDGGDQITGVKAPSIKYAFVVTLEAPKNPQIFNDILEAYSQVLTEIQPRISTPVPVSV